jgi:uncharacterized protein (UPF0332 family)
MTKEQLAKNAKTIMASAEMVYTNKDYTSATILYFKAIFTILDFALLGKYGRAPKDHGERFNMLREGLPEMYVMLDRQFGIYRDTYTISIDRETCDKVRENADKIAERFKI